MMRSGRHRRGAEGENRLIPPVVWLLAAAACLVGIYFLAVHGFQAVQDQRLVSDNRVCGSASSTTCLQRLEGTLDGPYFTRRSPGNEWSFTATEGPSDTFDMPGSADEALEALGGTATVLLREGDVVAVELPSGAIPTWGLGWRGAAASLVWIFIALGLMIGSVDFGLRRRRSVGSWWRRHGRYYVNPGSPAATLLLLPGCVAFLPMALGVPWWQLWLVVLGSSVIGTLAFLPPSSPKWLPYRSTAT